MKRLPRGVRLLAERQDGVLTAAQLLALGVGESVPARRVRAGLWQRAHHGVYVLHSGPLGWRTRARAGLLYAGAGAALSHRSAGFVHGLIGPPPRLIEVSVPAARRVTPTQGLRVHLRRTMPAAAGRLLAVDRPTTVVDLLGSLRTDDDALGLLCRAVRSGTHPKDVLQAVAVRSRVRNRQMAIDLLGEVAEGIESPLEHRYHRDVELRHGLPRAVLQQRQKVGGRWIRADRVYEGLGVRIELDGEIAHPGGRTDDDVWRDNAVIIALAELTLRYRWRHVAITPCATAIQVAAALRSRGWTGGIHPCAAPGCPVKRLTALHRHTAMLAV